jgi:outer membrane lipoprotein-sorting protein
MKKLTMLMVLAVVVFSFFAQGCQSQQEKEEAAAREKMKKWGKDFTPDKYMEGKGKPKKPYWEN